MTDTQTLSCGCLVDRYQLLISCSAEHDPTAPLATESSPAEEGAEDERTYTEDEYIEYGAVQYRRGKAQAEYEAAHPLPAEEGQP